MPVRSLPVILGILLSLLLSACNDNHTTLSWSVPVEREDGSELKLSEIAGYRLYIGKSPGDYFKYIRITDPTVTRKQIPDLPAGTLYFAITTIDTNGKESAYSSEVMITQ